MPVCKGSHPWGSSPPQILVLPSQEPKVSWTKKVLNMELPPRPSHLHLFPQETSSSSPHCAGRWSARTCWPWHYRDPSSCSLHSYYSTAAASCLGQRGPWGLQGMGSRGQLGSLSTRVSVSRQGMRPLPSLGDEDKDVARERERVSRRDTQGDVLVLRDLTKVGEAEQGWGQGSS